MTIILTILPDRFLILNSGIHFTACMLIPPRFPLVMIIFVLLAFPAKSTDCSIAWEGAIPLSSDSVYVTSPYVVATGDTIHVCWWAYDYLGLGGHDGIQYSRSTDGGASFSAPLTLEPAATA